MTTAADIHAQGEWDVKRGWARFFLKREKSRFKSRREFFVRTL